LGWTGITLTPILLLIDLETDALLEGGNAGNGSLRDGDELLSAKMNKIILRKCIIQFVKYLQKIT